MTPNIWYTVSVIITIMGVFYVITNILFQKRAEKELEKLIRQHKKFLIERINCGYSQKVSFHRSLNENIEEEQMLLSLIKTEIEKLDKNNKMIMKKTFNRKDHENQLRYTLKLLVESGLLESFQKKEVLQVSA